jgi:ABC-type xylose transport system permease subunit
MRMEFNGNVGQVAGGNINNYGVDDLGSLSREQVAERLVHLRERLTDARKKMILNPIVGWMALGILTFFVELFSGIAFSSSILLLATMVLGVLVPYFFFIPIQKKYGRLVYAYRASIDYVEIFQHSRGWA